MKNDALKQLWRSAARDVVSFDKTALAHELRSELSRFDQGIRRRDMGEIIAAVVLVPIFGACGFFVPGAMAKAGLWLMVPYCLLVIYLLRRVKKYKVTDYTLPLKEYLTRHRVYLVKERQLINSVLYWYLLPPVAGMALFFTGVHSSPLKLAIYGIVIAGLYAYVYKLNKDAVKNDFDPLIRKLDEQLKELREEEAVS